MRQRLIVPFALALAVAAPGCDYEHRATLDAIVRDQVPEQQLPSRISLKFEVRERGTPSWDNLLTFLATEPPSSFTKLREGVKKYPKVLYHTTAWQMTWLFVDEQGIVRDYYLTSQ